jgi:two-component system, OmpR family, phosphate regulon sensor histidine kinase PhoR
VVRSRRAWVTVLSVLALLAPAAGIAYLGAVSYRDEKGAVSAQQERQRQAALAIARRIDQAIGLALDAVDRTVDTGGTGAVEAPLARFWFWIDSDGQLRRPRVVQAIEPTVSLERSGACAAGLEVCVREITTRQGRLAKLHAAQTAEGAGAWSDAKRQYTQLASADDTGPAALLGLARVLGKLGDARGAEAELAELDRRFPDRNFEGVPVKLVAAILRAQTPAAMLEVADAVVGGAYNVDAIVKVGVLSRLRERLDLALRQAPTTLPPELARRRAALDERMAELRTEARMAAGLADDVPELVHTATLAWRGHAAAHQPARILIYRRRADGTIVGIAVDAHMLEQAAGHDPSDDVATHVQPLVLPTGARPPRADRELLRIPLGEALSDLSLALVNPVADADPLDEVIRGRSRRHVVFTSALALALGLGLLLMIRGAARARELAQLKSDFVSTVSHELKTPLTSIRMFAEMLEQGVAKGDQAKMHRYHGVIVQESQRLGLLIANLLDYAQIEKGTRRYTPTREQVADLARHAVATFETLRGPDAPRNPIEVEVSSDASVMVDRDVVVQAVLNLISNATKYGGDHPIEVRVTDDDLTASIAVTDHGPGIPAHEQARIFREFYRAPEAYRSGVEGTGLGLALVKRHIEALGGSVEVASTIGQGATFTIRLPREVA